MLPVPPLAPTGGAEGGYRKEQIVGDLILSVGGHSKLETDGKEDAQKVMKMMLGTSTEFIVKRGYEIKILNLEVTQTTPSGLRISDYDDFLKWAKNLKQIAIVKSVHSGSPADFAGVREKDIIVWCNGLHFQSPNAFSELLIQIKNSEDKSLIIFLVRYGELQQVIIYPKKWESGKGLTGMAIAHE